MSRGSSLLLAVVIAAVAATAVHAQMKMPTPAPELKNADFMAGSWKLDGDMKPGPMGPGGPMAMTEECRWMEGNFFLVCHSKFSSKNMGSGSGVALLGYDADDKMYTYDEFNSMGEAAHSKGSLDANTWTWTSEEKWEGKPLKGRFVMKVSSPTAYTFQYDISQDGTNWTTMMDGKATKAK